MPRNREEDSDGPDEALMANVRRPAGHRHPRVHCPEVGAEAAEPAAFLSPRGVCPMFRTVAAPTREWAVSPSAPAAARA